MKDLKLAAQNALAALADSGADMAAAQIMSSEVREFNVDGGEFSLFRTLFDDSVSLTGYREGRRGTAQINRLDDVSIQSAAAECMLSAESAEPDPAWELAPGTEEQTFVDGCPEPDMDKFFSRLRELMDTLREEHPSILMEQLIACHRKYHMVYRNSKGAAFDMAGGQYEVSLMFSAHEGEAASSFFGTGVLLDGLEKPLMEYGSIAQDIAAVERQIHTRAPEGKYEGTVVFTPGCLGEVLDTALENFAGDYPVLTGTGLWRDKLGQKVAGEDLTVAFAPGDSRMVCPEHFTAEGFPSEDYTVVENGVLKALPISLYVANRTGNRRAPNSGSGMTVTPGRESLEDILSGISRGLLVARISGGEPGANGEFSMVAKNSFLIENGKITDAVSETMINGNLADMLQNLRAVSAETVCDGATVLPWAAFDGVTISGK